jgi:peroxiredoxin Q/BCP
MASVDDADTNKKFAEQEGADFPILSDPDKQVATAYGVLGPTGLAKRWTFYIGGDGKLLHIEKATGAVQTANAGETMAAKLEELATKGLIKRKK